MRLSTSVKMALGIATLVVLYFTINTIFARNGAQDAPPGPEALFTVVVEATPPQQWRDQVAVRGRTEALRKIIVRAETPGVIEATPAEPGSVVEAGAPLCRLRIDARNAALAEARAAFAKSTLDHEAATRLASEGFRSETAVAATKAALDLARANVEQATLAVSKTIIAAPWKGIFDQRLAETGAFLAVGDPCGVLIQQSPYLVTGAVSEREVAKIKAGDKGVARLATGEVVEGVVRLVANAADEATRTFRVELEIPNEDGRLRDGVTAAFTVFASSTQAHFVPRGALALDESGEVGVRVVEDGDIVAFKSVTLLSEAERGVWVGGLDGVVRVITRGQDFVTRGQRVAVVEAAKPS